MIPAYFVTGTDTGSGKTTIASALIRYFVDQGRKTVGMKPIASGCEFVQDQSVNGQLVNEDVTALIQASNVIAPLTLVNPYHFMPAIAPHIAASQAGIHIDTYVILTAYRQLSAMADIVVVEGAGGFLVPVNRHQTLADLAVHLNIPIILVVGMRLGCINHALLTVEAIQSRGLHLAGWVANQVDPEMADFEANLESLQARIEAPCLSVVRYGQPPQFEFS
jgi:dethiobiotin synthetase